jgi:hypothetical protein
LIFVSEEGASEIIESKKPSLIQRGAEPTSTSPPCKIDPATAPLGVTKPR